MQRGRLSAGGGGVLVMMELGCPALQSLRSMMDGLVGTMAEVSSR
jgi:hypothetical protein